MKSIDTNILVYAANEECAENVSARAVVDAALVSPWKYVIADQVLFELYRAVRSPRIFSKPLTATESAKLVSFYRAEAGFEHCCYESALFDRVHARLANRHFPFQRTHDAVLAETLAHAGVKTFFTRNAKDFAHNPFEVVNPID